DRGDSAVAAREDRQRGSGHGGGRGRRAHRREGHAADPDRPHDQENGGLLLRGGGAVTRSRHPDERSPHERHQPPEPDATRREVGEKKEVADLVRAFEDNFNAMLAKKEKEHAAAANADSTRNVPEHFVGDQMCARCHAAEAAQWKGTAHARAWATLVERNKTS